MRLKREICEACVEGTNWGRGAWNLASRERVERFRRQWGDADSFELDDIDRAFWCPLHGCLNKTGAGICVRFVEHVVSQ